jgi:asparagine synthase (glutamine-hydrolysing)
MLPGFLASRSGDAAFRRALPVGRNVSVVPCGRVDIAYWDVPVLAQDQPALALSPVTRTADGTVAPSTILAALRQEPASLTRLLPPFAATAGTPSGVILVADSMGYRQAYHTSRGSAGAPALSTSALLAARVTGASLDPTAVAVQSLLGWQLGQRTLFAGVEKLAPGAVARLNADGVAFDQLEPSDDSPLTIGEAVRSAANLLRRSLEALLDDHPDAVLQLTGGQDSRLLLSAIPPARRRGLRAMTLGVSGGDVAVASQLARQYGLDHEVHGLSGLDDITPAEAWDLARTAALRLDGMSDPVALAALTVGESSFEQGVRISGLGGEVARGFYYLGKVRERPVTRAEAHQLAAWRMFVNEAVEPGLLGEEFSAWGREAADNEVLEALTAGGKDWDRATDDLYLRHRMQRWAGVTDTAVAYQRTVINPMLDHGFLDIATRLAPADKANSLFLARLQMELDPELGGVPLEGRPAPARYAEPGFRNDLHRRLVTGKRLARKAFQRARRGNRAPAGGEVVAEKVVVHWREDPSVLEPVRASGFVRPEWLDGMIVGTITPRPSSVALLTNLIVATEITQPRDEPQQTSKLPAT